MTFRTLRSFAATLTLLAALFAGMAHAQDESAAPVNINQADATTLAQLDGVGSARAEAIIAYREENGPFEAAEDLDQVSGIGATTVERNLQRISVD